MQNYANVIYIKSKYKYLGHIVFKERISANLRQYWEDVQDVGYPQIFIDGFLDTFYPITSWQKKGKKSKW